MNLMSHGLVVGFTAALLPQLDVSKVILVDETSGSWIGKKNIFGRKLPSGFVHIHHALLVPSRYNRASSPLS